MIQNGQHVTLAQETSEKTTLKEREVGAAQAGDAAK